MESRYHMPPRLCTAEGRERSVGVELEMSRIPLEDIARRVQSLYGGRIEVEDRFTCHVKDSQLGDFEIEFDARWAHDRKKHDAETHDWRAAIERYADDALLGLAEAVVPAELVCPPLPLSQLPRLDAAIESLRAGGAVGTDASVLYAFGLQFNPELPALDADTIRRYLQAFACLADWLREREQVPPTRRLSPFIRDYPAAYTRLLLRPDYRPDLGRLIDDYLEHNPTRNRALDMLPLFALIDEPRVRAAVPEQKINQRPTLHYRLPNSRIDRPDWSLHAPWNRWVEVEALADDEARLQEWMAGWSEHDRDHPIDFVGWRDKVTQWLGGH